jgi:hypothetical protein
MKAFFLSHDVPVKKVGDTANKDGRASIKLDDSDNKFDMKLLSNLEKSMKNLIDRVTAAALKKELSEM